MGSWNMCLVSNGLFFHFHDYGRKGNSSPLKMDGWNTILSYWGPWPIFRGLLLLVSGRVPPPTKKKTQVPKTHSHELNGFQLVNGFLGSLFWKDILVATGCATRVEQFIPTCFKQVSSFDRLGTSSNPPKKPWSWQGSQTSLYQKFIWPFVVR